MRKLLLITFLLSIQFLQSQEHFIDFIVPLKTYHFNAREKHRYAPGEGGNAGLIISYTNNKKKVNNVFSAGYVKNSYGNWSMMATYGKSYLANKWLRVELNVGIATNYGEAYKATYFVDGDGERHTEDGMGRKRTVQTPIKRAEMMGVFYKNDIIPIAMVNAKINIYKNLGVVLTVNPLYVNGALVFSLK